MTTTRMSDWFIFITGSNKMLISYLDRRKGRSGGKVTEESERGSLFGDTSYGDSF